MEGNKKFHFSAKNEINKVILFLTRYARKKNMKTNKSLKKRIKKTKKGKLITRKKGQGHFNAKESGSKSMKKKRSVLIKLSAKDRARF